MACHKGLDLWNIGPKLKLYILYKRTYHKGLDLLNIRPKLNTAHYIKTRLSLKSKLQTVHELLHILFIKWSNIPKIQPFMIGHLI